MDLKSVSGSSQEISGTMQSVSGGIKRLQKVTCAFQGGSRVSVGIRGVLMCFFAFLKGFRRFHFQGRPKMFQGCTSGFDVFSRWFQGVPGGIRGVPGMFHGNQLVPEVFQGHSWGFHGHFRFF